MEKDIYTSIALRGNNIYERGIDKDGRRFNRRQNPTPILFTHTDSETGYKDIFGTSCMPKMFDNISEAKGFIRNSAVPVLGQEDFILQWISDNYGAENKVPNEMITKGVVDIEVDAPEFPNPEEAKWPVTCYTLYDSSTDELIHYSQKEWDYDKSELPAEVKDRVRAYQATEREILVNFVLEVRNREIDILSGWNSEGFDVPYMINRIRKVLGEKTVRKMSPFGYIKSKTIETKYGEQTIYIIPGINHLDYLALYKKFTFDPRPNYKLDTIAKVEGVEGKIPFDGSLTNLWESNPQKYMDYNIQDVNVILDLDKELNLFALATSLSYYAGITMESVFSPIKTWDAILYNSMRAEKKVLPQNKIGAKEEFEGAYVVPTKAGFWRWIGSFDLTSLYPSMIRMMNISPETIIEDLFEKFPVIDWVNKKSPTAREQTSGDYTLTPNGRVYTKEFQGVIPREIGKVFFQRKENKRISKEAERKAADIKNEHGNDIDLEKSNDPIAVEYREQKKIAKDYDVQQHNRKILINSLYGALGSRFFRFYDAENALSVTSMGQLANRWMGRKLNEWLQKETGESDRDFCVAGDTDSQYVTFDSYVEKKLKPRVGDDINKLTKALNIVIEKKIQPYIDEFYKELYEYVNGMENTLAADREVIAPTGVFVAKKRYFLDVRDKEGTPFPNGKLKITGLETQRGSTPPWVTKTLKKCYRLILDEKKDEFYDYIANGRWEYRKQSIYDVANVTTANNIKQYTDKDIKPVKGCPGHIKAAAAYNRVIHSGKWKMLEPIGEGDKVCTIMLKNPNPLEKGNPQLESFAWLSGDYLPQEPAKEIEKYLDYEGMFQKTFLKPVHAVLDAINWPHEKTTSMEDFF